jgi:hypothetical protein
MTGRTGSLCDSWMPVANPSGLIHFLRASLLLGRGTVVSEATGTSEASEFISLDNYFLVVVRLALNFI